jgi:capsular polysaccharide transport system permease protein
MEHKFKQFQQSITPSQFNDEKFLDQHAKSILESDPALSNRIQIRINNLRADKKKEEIKKKLGNNGWNSISEIQKALTMRLNHRLDILKKLSSSVEENKNQGIELQADELNNKKKSTIEKNNIIDFIVKHSYISLVIIPLLIFCFYQFFIASERYESEAKVLVQQPDATSTLDASMAILSGLGVNTKSGADPDILQSYIYSTDMLNHLNEKLNLKIHYESDEIDFFSRLIDDNKEAFLDYYKDHISVSVESGTGIITIAAQGFTPEYSHTLVKEIVNQSEWYINSIGHQLAKSQLEFVQHEHENIEKKLQKAQSELLIFQQKNNLLDPIAEGTAQQQMTYGLEAQMTAKEAELKTLEKVMHQSSPRVIALKQELSVLKQQVLNQRIKLAQGNNGSQSVGDIMAYYIDLKIKMELAVQAYTSSQISLEKSRIEAYRQLKYLIKVQAPTVPDDSKYPDKPYNITLLFILFSMVYGIGKIIISTVKELS